MEGVKFRRLTDAQLERVIPNLKVLARSSPTDKKMLVEKCFFFLFFSFFLFFFFFFKIKIK